MTVAALIVAAGRGDRAGGEYPKQYSLLLGRPVLAWAVDALAAAEVEPIVVVIAPEHEELCRAAIKTPVRTVFGGATRTESVRAGLAAIEGGDIILVHDAARPGVTGAIVAALVEAVRKGADGVAPALPVADALRRADQMGRITGEVDRTNLMGVQTPQAFRAEALRAAYAALPAGRSMTDDLSVVAANGGTVRLITGDARLMKLTYAEDRSLLERILAGARAPCVGAGFDAHRFGDGDHVTLCGVRIAHEKGLVGHSDADAGWHALVDAILGALGEGDIGAHFPPSDPQWKGADSELFLRHAALLAARAGARILNVDITLVCERPKIGPHRQAMRARTAEVLGLPIERVSVKATTTEGMGFVGREEGLAAQASAMLDRPL
jgi:2-C-methyl-D-erythritol 4-phosphate cytidylyltransferase/2-C-methyl-D-erythritol 2,4-cyclodiphosphate synthase